MPLAYDRSLNLLACSPARYHCTMDASLTDYRRGMAKTLQQKSMNLNGVYDSRLTNEWPVSCGTLWLFLFTGEFAQIEKLTSKQDRQLALAGIVTDTVISSNPDTICSLGRTGWKGQRRKKERCFRAWFGSVRINRIRDILG